MALTRHTDRPQTLHPVEPRDFARDTHGLLEQLARGDATQRRWAARDLGGCDDAVPALAAHLACEADASVREAVFTSLKQIASPAVADGLLPLLRSEDAGLRNGAIEVLAGLPAVVAPRIDALLADADPDVRIFAVNLLADLPHAGVPDWLERVLRHELHVNVVGAALDVAAEVAGPALAEALSLVPGRFQDEPYIAFAALLALQRIEPAA